MPLANACTNTATSSTNRNSVRKASATPISVRRTHAGSVIALAMCVGASGRTSGPASATASVSSSLGRALISASLALARPRLQQVDQQQQREGRHQHHDGNRRGSGVVVL